MQGKMLEQIKPDTALLGPTIANAANETGRYYKLNEYRRAAFHVVVNSDDGILAGEEVTVSVNEAKTAAGGDAQALIEDVVITGLEDSLVVVTDLDATEDIEEGDTITLLTSDGLAATFTRAAATDTAEGEFLNAAGLVECIEAAGLGLSAEANVNVVTISATEAGSKTITMVEEAGQGSAWVPAGITTVASAIVEVYAPSMTADFQFVAVNVANGAAQDIVAKADIVRGLPIHSPVKQHVGARG